MTGFGYDIHRLQTGRGIILGGERIPCEFSIVAHSDGDVLMHAITDAMLGAAGLGDIGEHFPDTDPDYAGADSMELFSECVEMVESRGFEIVNIDATVVLERPKLKDYKDVMRHNIAQACGLPERRVNIKATTNEQLGPIGNREAIAAFAVCELNR
ncbi:MAG: 2-C-methyl-D-erythritol 2,4-cyclodiphosphate synthase [Candidatus Kapaibacterium sp.]